MGYIELGYSVGLSIGPLTASLLYYIGGYSLSFFFFGILMMLSLITLSYIEINDNIIDEDEELPNFLKLIFDKVNPYI